MSKKRGAKRGEQREGRRKMEEEGRYGEERQEVRRQREEGSWRRDESALSGLRF